MSDGDEIIIKKKTIIILYGSGTRKSNGVPRDNAKTGNNKDNIVVAINVDDERSRGFASDNEKPMIGSRRDYSFPNG